MSAARGWQLYSSQAEEVPGPFRDVELVRLNARPGQRFSISGRVDASTRARHAIGLQGVRTGKLSVVEPMAPGTAHGESGLLRGTLSFPELTRRAPEQLWLGERIEGKNFNGAILIAEYVNGSSDTTESEWENPHLRVVWRGSIESPRLGQPGALRSVVPSFLESKLARRGYADYFALATALLAFLAILSPRGEEEEKVAQSLQAEADTSVLRERTNAPQ